MMKPQTFSVKQFQRKGSLNPYWCVTASNRDTVIHFGCYNNASACAEMCNSEPAIFDMNSWFRWSLSECKEVTS